MRVVIFMCRSSFLFLPERGAFSRILAMKIRKGLDFPSRAWSKSQVAGGGPWLQLEDLVEKHDGNVAPGLCEKLIDRGAVPFGLDADRGDELG